MTRAFETDVPAEDVADHLDDKQAEAGSSGFVFHGLRRAIESREKFPLRVFADREAVVLDFNPDRFFLGGKRHSHARVFTIGVVKSVGNDV